jgi:hypothetical protein
VLKEKTLIDLFPRVWISELERSRITVEEVKPLLHDEMQFRNGNCTIRFNDNDDDDEEEDIGISFSSRLQRKPPLDNSKPMIRTTEMSPGEIFSSMLDKYDTKPGGNL